VSLDENKALHRRYFEEVVNAGDPSAIDNLFAPGYVGHTPGRPDVDLDGFKAAFANMTQTFSDSHVTVEHQLADGDLVGSHINIEAVHTGPLMGLEPTGKRVSYEGMEIVRIADGRIAEFWGLIDLIGMLQQLGVAPPT
jgi:predicted ester cyclase